MNIEIVYDRERGCGWRSEGGTYLVGGGIFRDCGKLPLPLDTPCPCCGNTPVPSMTKKDGTTVWKLPRGLVKIDVPRLFGGIECRLNGHCSDCMVNRNQHGYLIGVGSKQYSPTSFLSEALEEDETKVDGVRGISKRISRIPMDFKVGESPVFLAHREAITEVRELRREVHDEVFGHPLNGEEVSQVVVKRPGVFCIFVPWRIEYVTTGQESDEELEALVRRGITPIKVIRVQDVQPELVPAA